MSDSYDNNFVLTDSDCNVGEEGIYKPKQEYLFRSEEDKIYTLWPCQKVCEALTFLLDNIGIRF